MRVNFATKTAFRAALSTRATYELEKVTDEAKSILYPNGDYTLFDIPSSSFIWIKSEIQAEEN